MSVPAHDQRDFDFARKYDLPVRPVVRPADGALEGLPYLEPTTGGAREQRPVRRPHGRARRSRAWPSTRARRASASPPSAIACATGSSAASATGARPSPSSIARRTAWSACRTRSCPVMLPPDAPFTGEGGNPLEKVPEFVNAHLPALRRPGPARDGHHGHVRGLVLVLLPLPLAPQGRRPLRHQRRCATGSRWTSTWAGSSTPSCTWCTRASGRR